MSKENWILGLILIAAIIAVAHGVGIVLTAKTYRQQAVEHNCAAYDVTTGEWGWKSE